MTLEEHIVSLQVPPVLDVLGKFVHLRNARTGTTSMDEGPLRARAIHHRRGRRLWETVWNKIIVPRMGTIQDSPVLFTFVRNPWDRICSSFFHCRDRAKSEDNKIDPSWQFPDWVKRVLWPRGPGVNMHFAEQYPTAYFEGKEFAFVGRFENMQHDWGRLSATIDVSHRLPHWNASGHVEYVDHYDEESRQVIAELYRKEIQVFRYEFAR